MPPTQATPDQLGQFKTNEIDYDLGSFIIQPIDGVFEPLSVRLNGLITYPDGLEDASKAPLIVLAHGRHSAEVENFRGLAYLAHHLSSYGYICTSISLQVLS
jgi:dipeptidyl aminopeptidase/acylaminoacyl peptidase